MERKLSILMVSAEAHPFAKVGGLADVIGALPRALEELGHEVKIAIPYYGTIKRKGFEVTEAAEAGVFDVALGKKTYPASVYRSELPDSKVEVLLVESEYYLDRNGIYADAETGEPYDDNAERFTFFARAVLRMLEVTGWYPDIIHCHDHQTGFIPAWIALGSGAPGLPDSVRTVFTIHNLAYQGEYPMKVGRLAGFSKDVMRPMGGIEFHGKVNLMKAGISYSDTITTVSPTYAREIQTPEYGYGLEGILRHRSKDLVGILNGADYSVWNPETDDLIPAKYTVEKPEGKAKCREHLLKRTGLKLDDDVPLVGIVSRLVSQKGFDILCEDFDRIMELDIGMVILGLGDKAYHELLTALAAKYEGRMAVLLDFNEELAHQIEAGSDMFLMPSKYEPCGLNQMYSMKYGTIPVVRATGGLADSVTDYDASGDSTGFAFTDYTAEALYEALERARKVFADPEAWKQLILRAMSLDLSWGTSARAYEDVYRKTLKKRRTVKTG
jgi:starch synthase